MAAPAFAQRSSERFNLLSDVSQRITSILELDELLAQVTQLIQKTFKYYHVGIGLIEGDDVVYRVGSGALWDNPEFGFKPARLKVGREGVSGWVAGSGIPLLISDVRTDPRYIWMQGSQTKSEMTIPIITKGSVIGVLDIQSDQLNAFDEADLNFMQSLANQTGIAIENARLYSIAQHRAEQFRVITAVSQRITSILDINELLKQLVQLIQSTYNYYHIEIGLVEGNEVVFHMGAGELWEKPGFQAAPSRLKVGEGGVTGWVAATGKPLIVPDVSREPRYIPVEDCRTRSELTVPIMASGRVIGILDVESDHLDEFDETDLELMTLLANQAGIAIENARLYKNAIKVAALEERQRLARELHDSVTQSLYGITLFSQAASFQLAAEKYEQVDKHLNEINETSQEALAEMRLLIYQLRPPVLDKEGILTALQARLSAVEGRAGLKTNLKSDLTDRLPFAVEEGLYHIAQEALNNTLKHSHAKSVNIFLGQNGPVISLEIVDDGIGFDVARAYQEGKMGLPDMDDHASELGGQLTVTSEPGHGTRIRVDVIL
jgi:signal transduction histidine kinase